MGLTGFNRMRRKKQQQKVEAKKPSSQMNGDSDYLESLNVAQLKEVAKEKGVQGYAGLKRAELLKALKEGE